MYVFGGRSSQGKDLGTLSSLKLTTRKWFTFQNLGPGPSPRSGHSMTAFGSHKILVMGGENPELIGHENDPAYENYESSPQLNSIFVLDTLRINYPTDSDATTSAIASEQHGGTDVKGVNESRTPSAASGNIRTGAITGDSSTPPSSLTPSGTGHVHSIPHGGPAIAAAAGTAAIGATGLAAYGNSSNSNFPHSLSRDSPYVQQEFSNMSPRSPQNGKSLPNPEEHQNQHSHDHYVDDDSRSNTTFESADEERYKSSPAKDHLSNIPGSWQQVPSPSSTTSSHDSDTYNEPIKVSKLRSSPKVGNLGAQGGRLNTSLPDHSDRSIPNDENTPTPTTANIPHDQSIDSLSEPPVVIDQSTPRGSQVHLNADATNGGVSNVSQVIEQLKASNSWYETELSAAREAGYVSKSGPPVDVLKLRRVSQRLTQDNHQSLSERDILVAALSELKDELRTVQSDIQKQAEAASDRILAVEKERDALKEKLDKGISEEDQGQIAQHQATIVSLQKELSDSKASRNLLLGDAESLSTIDDLKAKNAQLEQQLRNQADRLVVAEHEVSQLRDKHDDLQGQHRELTSGAAERVSALAAAGAAITASQSKSNELSRQLDEHKTARADLESQISDLQRELSEQKLKLDTSEREISEHRNLLQASQEQNEHSSKALGDGIDKIVSMWSSSKFFKGAAVGATGAVIAGAAVAGASGAATSRGVSEEGEVDEDPRVTDLQSQLDLANKLHITHKEASEKATSDLTEALTQVSGLKRELAQSESTKQEVESELNTVKQELEVTKGDLQSLQEELEGHKKSLNDLNEKHDNLTDQISSQTEAHSTKAKELDEKLEQSLKEHKEVTDQRYQELEKQYNETLQYVRNSDKALNKTRDELTKHKDLNSKLQEEINELRLRSQQDEDETGIAAGERSVNSIGSSYNNKHFDLQLRDLKAQVIILQEERDELRASSLELKKKAINNAHDIEDAKAEVSRLAQENTKLSQRAKEAEDKVSVLLHSKRSSRDPIIDPESGQTLDSFSNDLEKIRNERERLSGILRESPVPEDQQ